MLNFAEAYRRTLDVINRGYGAYTTSFALPLFDEFLLHAKEANPSSSKIRLVTIWFGTNDAVIPGAPSEQHVDLKTFRSNLDKMVDTLVNPTGGYAIANQDQVNVILITCPPWVASMMDEGLSVGRKDIKVTEGYRQAVLDAGKEWKDKSEKFKVETVDLFGAIEKAAGGLGDELRPYFTYVADR